MRAGRSATSIACSVHVSSHARCHEIMLTNEMLESTAGPVLKPDLANPWKLLRYSALEVFLNDMRYINPRFTYLLTYLQYDTRCYFNVRSKADISQLNLPHGTDN